MSFREDIHRAAWKFANAAYGAETRPKMIRQVLVTALVSAGAVLLAKTGGMTAWAQGAAALVPWLPWPPIYVWGAWKAIVKRDEDHQMRLDYLKAPEAGLWAGEGRVLVTDLRQAYARACVLSDVITKAKNDYQGAAAARDAWRAEPFEPLGPDATADQRYGWNQRRKGRERVERAWKDRMVRVAQDLAPFRTTPEQAFVGPPHEADPAFEQACREIRQEVEELRRLVRFHAEKKRHWPEDPRRDSHALPE